MGEGRICVECNFKINDGRMWCLKFINSMSFVLHIQQVLAYDECSLFVPVAKGQERATTVIVEKIICPECKETVDGKIEHQRDVPWDDYYGHCEHCGYDITESEWLPVKMIRKAEKD